MEKFLGGVFCGIVMAYALIFKLAGYVTIEECELHLPRSEACMFTAVPLKQLEQKP